MELIELTKDLKDMRSKGFRVEHTKYELEEGGFGEVFNNPLFEVKEVTNEKG